VAGQRQRAHGSTQGHRRRGARLRLDPAPAAPPPPPPALDGESELLPEVREQWAQLWRSPLASAIDLRADAARLRRMFQAIDERLIVAAAIARNRLVAGSRGQPRLNPLVGYEAQLTREIERAMEHFGMTPLARFRLGIQAGDAAHALERMHERLDRVAARAQPVPEELAPPRALERA
jgi:P27 family predicted phage terminase small subunit